MALFQKLKISKFQLAILLMFFWCLCFGITDLDYYWQVDLGKAELHGNFYKIKDLFWGNTGLGEYLDHEWISNILFAILSYCGTYALVATKALVGFLVGLEFIRFIRHFNTEYSTKQYLILITVFLYCFLFLKIKAYSLSLIFVMESILIFEEYIKRRSTILFLKLLAVVVLWNNIHSGSVLLVFLVAGVYWLCYFKDIKTLLYGVAIFLSLGITPYGYKMLFFDLKHYFNPAMHEIVLDWKGLSNNEAGGILLIAFIIVLILLINKVRLSTKVLFLVFLALGINTMRHLMYMMPVAIMIIKESDIRINTKLNYNILMIVSVSLCILNVSTGILDCNKPSYNMMYIDSELSNILSEDTSDGFFNGDGVYVNDLGLKCFTNGAYPYCEDRVKDTLILTAYGSQQDIENIIEYYGLNRFLFNKYNWRLKFYLITCPLYDYLSGSDKYEMIYENDYLVYFVEKS